jgi:hypothetical protein
VLYLKSKTREPCLAHLDAMCSMSMGGKLIGRDVAQP